MSYLVIETWPNAESATIMMEDGENAVFDDEKAAQDYASEECQKGVVVKI